MDLPLSLSLSLFLSLPYLSLTSPSQLGSISSTRGITRLIAIHHLTATGFEKQPPPKQTPAASFSRADRHIALDPSSHIIIIIAITNHPITPSTPTKAST